MCTKLSVEFFSEPKSSNGSDQRISHIKPCVGGSLNRLIWVLDQGELRVDELTDLKSSSVLSSGERPPWIHRNCLFMTAARGRLQKDSIQAL